jgi:photosystem II stability/assembly factor-like uncharacterized protein
MRTFAYVKLNNFAHEKRQFFTKTILVMKIYKFVFLLLCHFSFVSAQTVEIPQPFSGADNQRTHKSGKAGVASIVFTSTDGGQTWKDISEGLPENLQEGNLWTDHFFVDDSGLHLRAGNDGIYHSKPNATAPFWKKESSPHIQGGIAPGKTGMVAYNHNSQFLQKINETGIWQPIYTNFQESVVRSVFETTGGTVFIGCDRGLFKSTDHGKNWKQVHAGGWVIKLVESNGVLLATSQNGILRSANDGESWNVVVSEGGVGINVERINGGFAAITFNTASMTRRVRTSYDGGNTWQPIDAGLKADLSIASIIQVGENFFCGHPNGIYRSSDKGKTWKLLLPSIEGKVFNLFVSGNVIYAVLLGAGC